MRYTMLTAAILMFSGVAHAADSAKQTALTIYSSSGTAVPPQLYRNAGLEGGWMGADVPGFAMVKETRNITLKDPISTVQFTDVPALIDPTTVSFASLTAPDSTTVLEQNYLYDVVSQQKVLQKYIGQTITVEQQQGDKLASLKGELLSARDGLTLKTNDGIASLQNYSNVLFPELPGGLMTKPTLEWKVMAKKTGDHKVTTSFKTEGITWWADYNALFTEDKSNANKGTLDLGAWVTVVNQSGATYPDASLKLVAGEVQTVAQPQAPMMMKARAMEYAASSDAAGFTQKPLFEYHLYTLGRAVTLADNATKQIELFPKVAGIPVEKLLVMDNVQAAYNSGNPDATLDVGVFLKVKNSKDNKLGLPLPAGRVRVSQQDAADGGLEFIGEDTLAHTATDETVLVKLGNAFDVKGSRVVKEASQDEARREAKESIEIHVRNHKDQPVDVLVREPLTRSRSWKIIENSEKFTKVNAQQIEFPISVKANGETVIRYTVLYNW